MVLLTLLITNQSMFTRAHGGRAGGLVNIVHIVQSMFRSRAHGGRAGGPADTKPVRISGWGCRRRWRGPVLAVTTSPMYCISLYFCYYITYVLCFSHTITHVLYFCFSVFHYSNLKSYCISAFNFSPMNSVSVFHNKAALKCMG